MDTAQSGSCSSSCVPRDVPPGLCSSNPFVTLYDDHCDLPLTRRSQQVSGSQPVRLSMSKWASIARYGYPYILREGLFIHQQLRPRQFSFKFTAMSRPGD